MRKFSEDITSSAEDVNLAVQKYSNLKDKKILTVEIAIEEILTKHKALIDLHNKYWSEISFVFSQLKRFLFQLEVVIGNEEIKEFLDCLKREAEIIDDKMKEIAILLKKTIPSLDSYAKSLRSEKHFN